MSHHLNVNSDTVEQLLNEGGHAFTRLTPGTWRGHFQGQRKRFPFLVRLDGEGYLNFAIVPYLASPEDADITAALYDRLLQLNQVLLMAKFSIDDDLDVVLSVEWPTDHLDRSEFRDCLNVLAYYADEHFDELHSIVSAGNG